MRPKKHTQKCEDKSEVNLQINVSTASSALDVRAIHDKFGFE